MIPRALTRKHRRATKEKKAFEQSEQSFRQSNTKAGLPPKLYKQEKNPWRAQIGAIKLNVGVPKLPQASWAMWGKSIQLFISNKERGSPLEYLSQGLVLQHSAICHGAE